MFVVIIIVVILICFKQPSIVSSDVVETNDIINGRGSIVGKSYTIKNTYSNGKIKIEEKRMRL